MSVELVLLVVAAVGIVYLWSTLSPSSAERTYNRLETLRKIGGAVVLFILAITFLQSGRWYLILIAILAIALAALYFVVEEPHKGVVT